MTTNTEVDSRLIEQLFVLEKGDADHYRILFIDYSNPEVTFCILEDIRTRQYYQVAGWAWKPIRVDIREALASIEETMIISPPEIKWT